MAYKRISPMPVAEGGTGDSSLTAYAVLCGGTTSTGAVQSIAGVGTSGQILTSNGAGALPTFQAAPASGIQTINGNSGSVTGSTVTLTGGTTGAAFTGVSTTMTMSFAGITANGGTVSLATDATTSTINVGSGAGVKTSTFGSTNSTSATTVQSGSGALNITSTNGALTINSGTGALGISTDASATTVSFATGAAVKTTTLGSTNTTSSTAIKSGTGNIAMNSGLTVDSSGRNYNTVQPAFSAALSTSTANNVTGDGTTYTIICNTEIFDQGSNYNNSTGTFTAPITGRYFFKIAAMATNLASGSDPYQLKIVTTARTYECSYINAGAVRSGGSFCQQSGDALADMTAGDTCTFAIVVAGGTKTVGVYSTGSADCFTFCSGMLVC